MQATAYQMGMEGPHFEEFYPDRPVDASHPDILLDFNRCILCELCVRASRDVDGKNIFAIGGHGIGTRLLVDSDSGRLGDTGMALADRAAGICPVGVILPKRRGFQGVHPGQVLELELERDGGRWIYEIRLLQAVAAPELDDAHWRRLTPQQLAHEAGAWRLQARQHELTRSPFTLRNPDSNIRLVPDLGGGALFDTGSYPLGWPPGSRPPGSGCGSCGPAVGCGPCGPRPPWLRRLR